MKRVGRRAGWAVAAGTLLLLASCATRTTGPKGGVPDEPPGIEGYVVRYSPGSGSDGAGTAASIMVEGRGEQPAGAVSDKAAVTVPKNAKILDAQGSPADASQLGKVDPSTGVGPRVRVWFEGPVAESYPVQGTAKAVQILDE